MKILRRWPFVQRPNPHLDVSAPAGTSLADKPSPAHDNSAGADSTSSSGTKKRLPHSLPKPALRWVGEGSYIALREFDFARDADAVCSWQQETYSVNFPDFRYTDGFASAFRHDLRRGALDPNHAIFVLDEGYVIGFLWLVICENTWTGERYGYVNNVYLIQARRGQGLAREMMAHAERWFRSRGIKRARLTVTSSNSVACKLYEQCGYETTRWEMEKEL
jgi:GNAT superfamily N-acetyltransferase